MKLFLFMLLLTTLTFAQQEPKVEVILDKEKYLVGESLNILVTYFNNTSSTISIPSRYIQFEMITGSGENLDDVSLDDNKLKTGNIVLMPGDKVSFLRNLINNFGVANREMHSAYILSGSYTLRFSTCSGSEVKLLQSFNIEVSEPEGMDKEAFDAWALVSKILRAYPLYEHYNHSELLEEVFEKYPNSIYSGTILQQISILYAGKNRGTGKNRSLIDGFREKICEEYFTSFEFRGYLLHIISQMANKEVKLAYLDKLIAKNQLPTMRGYMQQIKRDVIAGKWTKEQK